MRLAVVSLFALPFVLSAQVRTTCDTGLEVDLEPGAVLRMHIRSGDTDIVGTTSSRLRVACEMRHMDRMDEVRLVFDRQGNGGVLKVQGGASNDNFHVRIEIPQNSHLWVRSPAGDLTVSRVSGDKDIELHAGDLKIEVGDPAEYAHTDASIKVGDLDAYAFGIRKSGFFRCFRKDNSAGKYRLHAHLGAGDLVLK